MKYHKKLLSAVMAAAVLTALAAPSVGVITTAFAAGSNGVCINEVCAKNTTHAAPDGGFYDWIELYNGSGSSVDLSGFGLSDKPTKVKYTFPEGSSISAGGRIMIYCDSNGAPEIGGTYTAKIGIGTSGDNLYLTSPDGSVIDEIVIPPLASDVSYGRCPDGSDTFGELNMTPNAANSGMIAIDVPEPILSQEGGFYDSGFELSITAPEGTKVYYTTDGRVPTTNDPEFTSPIRVDDMTDQPNNLSARSDIKPNYSSPTKNVDKAFIISAIAVDKDGNVSDTVTAAYFIGLKNKASYYQNIKIVSLTTDADNLFDEEKGIYVLGNTYEEWRKSPEYSPATQEWNIPANYTQRGRDWERPVTMQIYVDGKLDHSQDVGIRIHGGASRSAAQKSFNVYARADYGLSKFEYNLFDGTVRSEATGKKIKEFDSFILRNAGNDNQSTRIRDKVNQWLVRDRDFLEQGMSPCIVFINGEFWGHYEITERISKDYIADHTGVDKKSVCIVKNEELEEGSDEAFRDWEELKTWLDATDFSSDANYKKLCERVDMDSFIDYMAAEMYIGNYDFGENNNGMWKTETVDPENKYADGKWRFLLFDTEYSAGLYGMQDTNVSSNTFQNLLKKDSMMASLFKAGMKNETFKKQFALVFMDIANVNFDPDTVNALIDEYSVDYAKMTADTRNRFEASAGFGWPGFGGGWGGIGGGIGGGGNSGYDESTFRNDANTVRQYFQGRKSNIARSLANQLGISGNLVDVKVENDTNKGTVKVNTTYPEFKNGSWKGSYFADYPITLSVEPAEGVEFSYWETADGEKLTATEAEFEVKNGLSIKAVYDGAPVAQIKGDVNGDGVVNAADLVVLSKWLLNTGMLNDWQRGDICEDGVIDVYDLAALRKIVAKK